VLSLIAVYSSSILLVKVLSDMPIYGQVWQSRVGIYFQDLVTKYWPG